MRTCLRRLEPLGAGDAGRTLPGASGGAQPCATLILDLGPPNSETINFCHSESPGL